MKTSKSQMKMHIFFMLILVVTSMLLFLQFFKKPLTKCCDIFITKRRYINIILICILTLIRRMWLTGVMFCNCLHVVTIFGCNLLRCALFNAFRITPRQPSYFDVRYRIQQFEFKIKNYRKDRVNVPTSMYHQD